MEEENTPRLLRIVLAGEFFFFFATTAMLILTNKLEDQI